MTESDAKQGIDFILRRVKQANSFGVVNGTF